MGGLIDHSGAKQDGRKYEGHHKLFHVCIQCSGNAGMLTRTGGKACLQLLLGEASTLTA
jgi:hypothetical protein